MYNIFIYSPQSNPQYRLLQGWGCTKSNASWGSFAPESCRLRAKLGYSRRSLQRIRKNLEEEHVAEDSWVLPMVVCLMCLVNLTWDVGFLSKMPEKA